jgi:hypothetical protein
MGRLQTFKAIMILSASLGAGTAVNAQTTRYQPSRPTVSPYLNLFREQTGAVPNYQALVRPLQRQNEAIDTQRQINAQRSTELGSLQAQLNDLSRSQAAGAAVQATGKKSWFFQPSQRQRFMDTAPYYSRVGSGTAGR